MRIIYLYIDLCYRYIDDVILTSNESQETFEKLLEEANSYHPNIKLHWEIGKCVAFLDLHINNTNGTLSTSVYHKDAAEPYVIPFKSDHPRHIFGNIIQGALVRAVRYSSTLNAFNDERRQIRLILLYNGYVTIPHFFSIFILILIKLSIKLY